MRYYYKMEWTKKVFDVNGSTVLVIPADLAKHLDISPGDTITMKDDSGKHGLFISFWKCEDKAKKK